MRRKRAVVLLLGIVAGGLLLVPLGYFVLPWTPWGAGYTQLLRTRSPLGDHEVWTLVRYYGLSSDDVALFVDGVRACDWLSDEGALTYLEWVGASTVRVSVESHRVIAPDWWHASQIGAVQIDWQIESRGSTSGK